MVILGVFFILCKECSGYFVVIFVIWFDKWSLSGDGMVFVFVVVGIVIKGDVDGIGFKMFDIILVDGLIGVVIVGLVWVVDVKDKVVF